MAIQETQKVDYLWKKLGYGRTKTDVNSVKGATNESIASPLLLLGGDVWSESGDIPNLMPSTSGGVVTVYPTTTPIECSVDITASTNRTWKTNLTNWIPPQIGSTYLVKVYIHDSGDVANAASSGTQVLAAGSGSNDEWFFDYQSGVLNFIGSNLPSGVNFTGKSVYISGARYTGNLGVGDSNGSVDVSELESKINDLISKFISVDERMESIINTDYIVLKLEDNTTGATVSEPTFFDGSSGGDTTEFVVDTDDRGVFTLNGVPQPTVEVPRGDSIIFDLSALDNAATFDIYRNGSLLTDGVSRNGTDLTLDTSQVPLQITTVFYKSTVTTGLGWIINILDT